MYLLYNYVRSAQYLFYVIKTDGSISMHFYIAYSDYSSFLSEVDRKIQSYLMSRAPSRSMKTFAYWNLADFNLRTIQTQFCDSCGLKQN
jgi:hypothetical protein